MIEQAIKLLNGDDVFQKHLQEIIEVFVEYYGEDKREYIEKRFNSLTAFCFSKPDEKNYIISKTLEAIQKKYYESFFTKYDLENNSENVSLYLPQNLISPGFSLMEKLEEYTKRKKMSPEEKKKEVIDSYLKELKKRYNLELTYERLLSKKGTPEYENFISKVPGYISQYIEASLADVYIDIEEERLKKMVVEKLNKIDPSITLENFDELYASGENDLISKLDSMLTDYETMKENFTKEIEPLQPYMEYYEKCKILKREIEEKNLIDLILKYKEYIPQSELEKLNNMISQKKSISLYELPITSSYFGSSIGSTSLLEAFSKESEKVLKEGKPAWQVSSIQYDRVRFFKNHGINKGMEYEAYEQDPECLAVIPSELVINELIDAKKKAEEQAKIEYYRSLPDYKKIIEQIEALHLVSQEPGLDPNLYENTLMCICANITYGESGPELKPLGFFRLTHHNIESIDAYIIHELNHVYELNFVSDTPEQTTYTCGWDIVEDKKNEERETTLKKNETKRDYELFSEIINELISQDICKRLHENGIYIFGTPENDKITHKSSYEQSAFIIRDFYSLYIEEIKESRRTRDMTHLFNKVGEQNFNDLNELFHIFNGHFNEFQLMAMYRDLKEGKETEDTKFYQSIIEKRDAIMAKMQQHTEEYIASQALK